MAYARVNWQDNVIPVDAAHMNVMDSYIATLDTGKADLAAMNAALALKADTTAMNAADALKVDKDSVVVAATRVVANKLLVGDANPAFQIKGDGQMSWGPGGGTAVDLLLYRSAVGVLKTDQNLRVQNYLDVDFGGTGAKLRFGSSVDTTLYRLAANRLATDGMFTVGNSITVTPNVYIRSDTGRLYFGLSDDAGIYRLGANQLKSDGSLYTVNGYTSQLAAAGASFQNKLLAADAQPAFSIGGDGKQNWGPGGATAPDTTLNRKTANQLETSGTLWLHQGAAGAGALVVDNLAADGSILVGKRATDGNFFTIYADGKIGWTSGAAAPDTNLYRYGVGYLKTDQNLIAGQGLFVGHNLAGVGSTIAFGNAADTTLTRSAASTLRANGDFRAGGGIFSTDGGANQISLSADGSLYFGSAFDTRLYRATANKLQTPASFLSNDLTTQYGISMDQANAGSWLIFGSASDVHLNRGAAGFLTIGGAGNTGFYFADSSVNLFRVSGTTRLKMDRNLNFTNYTGAGTLYGPVLPNINGTPGGGDVGDAQTGLIAFDWTNNRICVRCNDGVFRGVTLT